jgi:BirA family biotin operon repressor/biotin-[acetyl-CoA-carboxylase] ligase
MTVAYTTDRPLTEAVRITAAAAVAAVSAIEALTDKRPAVKWVNDIYLNGCKIGGILTEAVTRGDGSHRMIVGLGINLTTTEFPEGLRAPASCLFSPSEAYMASTAFADRLAGEITRRLLEAVDGIASPADCLQAYREHLLYVGERVLCTRGSEAFEGVILGVDEGYSLLVSVEGETVTLASGEVSVRPAVL